MAEAELEKVETSFAEAKRLNVEGEQSKTNNDNLIRKIQLLEEELDSAEKNAKETTEK